MSSEQGGFTHGARRAQLLADAPVDPLAEQIGVPVMARWAPEDGYEREGWWTSPDHNPEGVRIRVGATHRKLPAFLNALLDAGLEAERFIEPPPPVPAHRLWRCRRH